MKRFVVCLAGLLALPAFAEIAPLYFEEFEAVDTATVVPAEEVVTEQKVAPQTSRNNPRGRVASRDAASVSNRSAAATGRANVATRASRSGVVSRNAVNGVAARNATARSASNVAARPSRNAASTNQIATTRRAMQNGSANVARAGVTTNDTVNAPIYSGNSKASNVVARASMRAGSGGAVRARIPTISASVDNTASTAVSAPVATNAASATAAMDELAQVTAFCKAQYTECMDNFCNVLDDNQGRCSCSKNIKNYEKTEVALKEATEALQDVAQQIQYIGLTGDEIETLFTQTEAEAAMSANTDNSQLKNDLDKIRGLLVGVKSGTASSTEVADGLSMDLSGLMNFNIDSTGFNLGSLFGNTTTANTNSISNQRGEQLYKTAAARCKAAVLTDCQAQGVDISVVSNSYDLEIDKQCVAYERSLTDANDEMNQTVRNAKSVLQRARLMVAQQKNSYDLRGCVNALDSCMQDDFVCGNEYENCLDPFGKYIVEGEVVLGSAPGQNSYSGAVVAPQYSKDGLYSTWNFGSNNNAWGSNNGDSLTAYIADTMPEKADGYITETSTIMSEYLQYKIGYHEASTNKNHGMCMSVLNKCQDYTYDNGVYQANNPVVREYLTRTLVQIKAKQDEIISSYAEGCIADVSSCLGENNYDSVNVNSTKSKIAINACRSQIITCMSVNGDATADPTPAGMAEWVNNVMVSCPEGTSVAAGGICIWPNAITKTECDGYSGVWNSASGYCAYKKI
ncbi:MAG: hypothetical protein J6R52_01415 [Alphaproteobacteria bacterium]|nr:hypothetical protein [Alphaproteobacteria bacterium]